MRLDSVFVRGCASFGIVLLLTAACSSSDGSGPGTTAASASSTTTGAPATTSSITLPLVAQTGGASSTQSPYTSTTVAPTTAAPASIASTITSTTGAPAATAPAATSPAATATSPAATATSPPAGPTSTTSGAGPLEFVDGAFLGIRQGTPLTVAAQALGLTAVPISEVADASPIFACTGTPDPQVIRSGGLTLVFESSPNEPAVLTNWTYTGGPVAGFSEMVAPHGIRIDDSQDALIAAYPDAVDDGGEIRVGESSLGFVIDEGRVTRFGVIDCVFGDANEE